MKVVVKIGGSLVKNGLPTPLLEDIGEVARSNQVALVHGGGELVTDVARRLGKEQSFITSPEGIRSRYTDMETVEIYAMVMCGMVAKRIVLALLSHGVRAVSLSGLDGRLLIGKRKKKLLVLDDRGRKLAIDGGYTGRVVAVNSALLEALMGNGYLPVISPVAVSESNEPLNIDGDRAAASVAKGIGAERVVFVTDVDGLKIDGKVVEKISLDVAKAKLPEIGFGMQKKVIAAIEAIESGVGEAVICSGLKAAPLRAALSHSGCTVISS